MSPETKAKIKLLLLKIGGSSTGEQLLWAKSSFWAQDIKLNLGRVARTISEKVVAAQEALELLEEKE